MEKKIEIQPVFYSPEMDEIFVACMESLERVFMLQDRKVIKIIGQKDNLALPLWVFRDEFVLIGTTDWSEDD